MKIRDLPPTDRPREKAEAHGIKNLTDCELLSLLIGSGVQGSSAFEISAGLLGEFKGLYGLSKATFFSLKGTRGLSKAKALSLAAAFELGKRVSRLEYQERQVALSPERIFEEYRSKWEGERREILVILMIGKKGDPIKEKTIYKGTAKGMLFDERDIVSELVMDYASSYYLIHNHPSGNPLPSTKDIRATTSLSELSREFGFEMLDHVVVGDDDYFSFREARLL